MKKIYVIGCLASLALGSNAFGQTVALKKAWDVVEEQNKTAMTTIKEQCGIAITVTEDKNSFKEIAMVEGPAHWCPSTVASVVTRLCEDADYKAAVAKQVKKVVCVYDASLKTDSASNYGNKVGLKGRTLEARFNKDSANVGEKVLDMLKAAL